MTRAVRIVLLGLLVAGVVGFFVGPTIQRQFGASYTDPDRLTVKKAAYEGYPAWVQTHPGQCPRVGDLMATIERDSRDSWGHPYVVLCGADMPREARGIAVFSSGEDGKPGTDDDIRSWE